MLNDTCLIIATKDRSANIRHMLAVINDLEILKEIQICIADSSLDSSTQEICKTFSTVRWIDTKHKGKTESLNAGVNATQSAFVAFLDDDAVPYENIWLRPMLEHFQDPQVGYVSGRVLALEQRTEAQKAWQQKGALDKGPYPMRLDQAFYKKFQLKGLQIQLATMGANHVVRRSVFDSIGLHDERFGPGQKIPGAGADLDLTYRVLRGGYAVVYEPQSAAYHRHPETFEELKSKLFEYGIGDTAIHSKFLSEFGDIRSLFQLLYRPGQNVSRGILNLVGRHPLPVECSLRSVAGNLVGPFWYLRHRKST